MFTCILNSSVYDGMLCCTAMTPAKLSEKPVTGSCHGPLKDASRTEPRLIRLKYPLSPDSQGVQSPTTCDNDQNREINTTQPV